MITITPTRKRWEWQDFKCLSPEQLRSFKVRAIAHWGRWVEADSQPTGCKEYLNESKRELEKWLNIK